MQISRGLAIGVLLSLGTLAGVPLFADDVYLKNGRSFEGVVAEVGESQVRIQMPGGSLSLPLGAVARVEKSDSTFGAFLQRKQDLLAAEAHAHGERRAADWLDLARWAKRGGFSQGAREAALTAADLDPQLAGLAPILVPFGYVYEARQGRWVSHDEAMRLQGFIQEGGQWLSREQFAAEQAERQQAFFSQQAAGAAAQGRDDDALAQLAQLAQNAPAGGVTGDNAYYGDGWPVLYGGGFVAPGSAFGRHPRRGSFGGARVGPPFRQPGSLPGAHPRSSGHAAGTPHAGGVSAGGHFAGHR